MDSENNLGFGIGFGHRNNTNCGVMLVHAHACMQSDIWTLFMMWPISKHWNSEYVKYLP